MSLRDLERESIRAFVQFAADERHLCGRVLDHGCGKQPYRDIVEAAGGRYEGFDRVDFPANVSGEDIGESPFKGFPATWNEIYASRDAVLCTQVVQYVPRVDSLLADFHALLSDRGFLVMTYPTNWAEVEPGDIHRFTRSGMEKLLTEADFDIVHHTQREIVAVTLDGENLYAGYGVIARA